MQLICFMLLAVIRCIVTMFALLLKHFTKYGGALATSRKDFVEQGFLHARTVTKVHRSLSLRSFNTRSFHRKGYGGEKAFNLIH